MWEWLMEPLLASAIRYFLIEPLGEYLSSIEKVASMISEASHEIATAFSKEGGVLLMIHQDLVSTSSTEKRKREAKSMASRERFELECLISWLSSIKRHLHI
jgi:hypothetical protein